MLGLQYVPPQEWVSFSSQLYPGICPAPPCTLPGLKCGQICSGPTEQQYLGQENPSTIWHVHMLSRGSQKISFFLLFPPLSGLISWFIYTLHFKLDITLDRLNSFSTWCASSFMRFTLWSWRADFFLCYSEDAYDLTITVTVAECNVFVLLFDFHLHCLAPAEECKQAPLPGSAKRGGNNTMSSATYKDKSDQILWLGLWSMIFSLSINPPIIFLRNRLFGLQKENHNFPETNVMSSSVLTIKQSKPHNIQFTTT